MSHGSEGVPIRDRIAERLVNAILNTTRGGNGASGRFGCTKCGAAWSGHRIEHCTICHQSFSGTTAGDRHRTGDHGVKEGSNRRRCRTSDEMRDLGMAQNDRGIWTNGGESPWAR